MPATHHQNDNLIRLLQTSGLYLGPILLQHLRGILRNRAHDATLEVPIGESGDYLAFGPGFANIGNHLLDSLDPIEGVAADIWRDATRAPAPVREPDGIPGPRERDRRPRSKGPPTRPTGDHVQPKVTPPPPPNAWDLLFRDAEDPPAPKLEKKGERTSLGTLEAWDKAFERIYVDLYDIDRSLMNYAKAIDAIADVRLVNRHLVAGAFEVGVLLGKLKMGSGARAKDAVARLQALLTGLECLWKGDVEAAGTWIERAGRRDPEEKQEDYNDLLTDV